MPLFDFRCGVCGLAFEAITSASHREASCPACLTRVGIAEAAPHSPLEVAARKLGVVHGRRARDGDDLERYTEAHGDDAAVTLFSEFWGPSFEPYQQLIAQARALGVDFGDESEKVGQAFLAGYLAGCGVTKG